jgi:hypothetical protein
MGRRVEKTIQQSVQETGSSRNEEVSMGGRERSEHKEEVR